MPILVRSAGTRDGRAAASRRPRRPAAIRIVSNVAGCQTVFKTVSAGQKTALYEMCYNPSGAAKPCGEAQIFFIAFVGILRPLLSMTSRPDGGR
jgi:hypothetical protein